MRISAILFALPSALFRASRRKNEEADKCHENTEVDGATGSTDDELAHNCVMNNYCRVFVIPKIGVPDNADLDEKHHIECLHSSEVNKEKLLEKLGSKKKLSSKKR